jgi:molecular chaperone GrpE
MEKLEKEQGRLGDDQGGDADRRVKVNDRRRFDPEGKPRSTDAGASAKSENMSPSAGQAAQNPAEEGPGVGPAAVRAQVEADNDALRKELGAARARIDDLARAFQALSNDREEFKQRLSRERERMLDIEKGNIAQVLLEVLDELDLSLQAAANDDSPLAQGVRLIRDGILAKLQVIGIERIDPLGQPFDPNLVEAADVEITTDPANDQKVVAVMRAGYRLKDRIIRPARAKIAKYLKQAEA